MKRLLLALVPWMALATAAFGQARSADVLYTHHDSVPQRAFRVGDECFVPIDGVQTWGWTVETHGSEVDLTAEGKKLSVQTRSIGGRPTIPLRRTIEQLGGETSWLPSTDTLSVTSPLTSIAVGRGKIKVSAALSVLPRVVYITTPSQLVVDLAGARLTSKTKQEVEEGSRLIQFKPNVVRVVIDLKFTPQMPKEALEESREIDLDVLADHSDEIQKPTEPDPGSDPQAPQPPPGDLAVNVVSDEAGKTRLMIPVGSEMHGPATFSKPDPETLEIRLPFVRSQVPADTTLATDAVVSVTSRVDQLDTIVTLKLARAMGAEVGWSAGSVTIDLVKPSVGDGKLAGKVVVVDPGHGGHDNGAHIGGLNEKDLNLSIGLKLAKKLALAGATVVMTRKTDVFIPLQIRCDIANRTKADFFISCHINSTGGSGSQSGGITFHHLGRPDCRLLAECIQSQIAKVNKLPDLGVWSDGRIYNSGFAVLRGTRMPGVLLELGFINHSRDRARIVTAEFQDSVTSAVVKGLRDFLGDRSE